MEHSTDDNFAYVTETLFPRPIPSVKAMCDALRSPDVSPERKARMARMMEDAVKRAPLEVMGCIVIGDTDFRSSGYLTLGRIVAAEACGVSPVGMMVQMLNRVPWKMTPIALSTLVERHPYLKEDSDVRRLARLADFRALLGTWPDGKTGGVTEARENVRKWHSLDSVAHDMRQLQDLATGYLL